MRRSRYAAGRKIALTFVVTLVTACSLIDLSVMEFSSHPSTRLEIVPSDTTPWVEFSLPPVRREAESLLTITGPGGDVAGWKDWTGSRLVFHPYEPLTPGALHYLKLQGSFAAESGTLHGADLVVPFYPVTDSAPPTLLSFSPAPGAIVGNREPLTLMFSRPMNRLSVERELSISPKPRLRYDWNADGTTLSVIPEPAWSNLATHRWQIPLSVCSAEGIPVTKTYSAGFLTQQDSIPPRLLYSGPAIEDEGRWSALDSASLTLDNITNAHQVYLEFSEPVDFPSLRSSLSINPDLSGHLIQVSESSYVYVRGKPFIAGTRYELILAPGLKDEAGNQTPEKSSVAFLPDIAALKIASITIDNADPIDDRTLMPTELNARTPIQGLAYAGSAPNFSLGLIISFDAGSPGFPESDQARRRALVESVSCRAIFPPDLEAPALGSFSWTNDRTLRLTISSLTKSAAHSSKFYRVTVTGGKPEACDAAGAYLADEAYFYFEAPL